MYHQAIKEKIYTKEKKQVIFCQWVLSNMKPGPNVNLVV